MSYFFIALLRDRLDIVLANAVNGNGISLGETIGPVERYWGLSEFDLGNDGFGKPDGGMFFRTANGAFFVFIEAKTSPWATELGGAIRQSPQALSELPYIDLDKLCRKNCFNSTVNGQLELRWRFVNAVQDAIEGRHAVVRERGPLNELHSCDRFYWRRRLSSDEADPKKWRSVRLENELAPLLNMFREVGDRFSLLVITKDAERPEMSGVRLLDRRGRELERDARERALYWMSLDQLTSQMLRPVDLRVL